MFVTSIFIQWVLAFILKIKEWKTERLDKCSEPECRFGAKGRTLRVNGQDSNNKGNRGLNIELVSNY